MDTKKTAKVSTVDEATEFFAGLSDERQIEVLDRLFERLLGIAPAGGANAGAEKVRIATALASA